jgi:hypothetical protein
MSVRARAALLAAVVLAGCAVPTPAPEAPRLTAEEGRARVAKLLPRSVGDRTGWAVDIYAAFAALQLPPSVENICAVIAITEQESTFRVDPTVPNLSAIAWKEIERQREKLGIPQLVLKAALALSSSDGRSYSERIDAATTERELSETFDDFARRVPLGERFLAERNPVRTGGPMQVSIAYAAAHAARKPYPYPVAKSIRDEVFTRRGGMYFGIAHLLDYPAAYESPLYRFADYNAGHYASRNAAFQKAVANLTGVALDLDGDLVVPGGKGDKPGATESATRVLSERLGLSHDAIRRDLEHESSPDLEGTRLWRRVFEMADRIGPQPAPRAVLPQIKLSSPKITRSLTTEWFARRVADRHRACVARA